MRTQLLQLYPQPFTPFLIPGPGSVHRRGSTGVQPLCCSRPGCCLPQPHLPAHHHSCLLSAHTRGLAWSLAPVTLSVSLVSVASICRFSKTSFCSVALRSLRRGRKKVPACCQRPCLAKAPSMLFSCHMFKNTMQHIHFHCWMILYACLCAGCPPL